MRHYKFFYRNDCHLCEDMYALIQTYETSHPISIERFNIDQNTVLKEQYGLLIPVLMDQNDNEICHYFFDKIRFELSLHDKI
ncbi:MAG: glutaredoxin family protein [Gammaproteobacteria bacterium]|nr:glutaredoxin family protein [Gammaproteobacteria bacterium]